MLAGRVAGLWVGGGSYGVSAVAVAGRVGGVGGGDAVVVFGEGAGGVGGGEGVAGG